MPLARTHLIRCVQAQYTTAKPAPVVLGSGRVLSTEETMAALGYDDRTSFWQAVRRAGLPFVRISARRAVFRERDLEAWMDDRTVGILRRPGGSA